MQDLMKKAGAPYDPSMIGVTREMLKNSGTGKLK